MQPSEVSNSTSASFSFTGSGSTGISYFRYQLDGAGFQTASSPVNLTGLVNGSHTFQVEAVDDAGNVSAPASYTWIIDTNDSSTTTTATSNPVGPLTQGQSATFTANITGNPSVGTVSFYLGSVASANLIDTENVSNGTATSISDSSLSVGNDTIIAAIAAEPASPAVKEASRSPSTRRPSSPAPPQPSSFKAAALRPPRPKPSL